MRPSSAALALFLAICAPPALGTLVTGAVTNMQAAQAAVVEPTHADDVGAPYLASAIVKHEDGTFHIFRYPAAGLMTAEACALLIDSDEFKADFASFVADVLAQEPKAQVAALCMVYTGPKA